MSEKLLPCPFCGSEAHYYPEYPLQISCSAAMTGEDDACPNNVILRPDEWNRRVYPAKVERVLKAAKAVATRLTEINAIDHVEMNELWEAVRDLESEAKE